jgi:hypothetical protein
VTGQFEVELESQIEEEDAVKLINPRIVNGYDGFGGVHNNIAWDSKHGWVAYTLHNKVIFENTKTRE